MENKDYNFICGRCGERIKYALTCSLWSMHESEVENYGVEDELVIPTLEEQLELTCEAEKSCPNSNGGKKCLLP